MYHVAYSSDTFIIFDAFQTRVLFCIRFEYTCSILYTFEHTCITLHIFQNARAQTFVVTSNSLSFTCEIYFGMLGSAHTAHKPYMTSVNISDAVFRFMLSISNVSTSGSIGFEDLKSMAYRILYIL